MCRLINGIRSVYNDGIELIIAIIGAVVILTWYV